jgi:hypothetical protein
MSVHAFVVAVLNPTRYILWLIRVKQHLPFAYRFHINHVSYDSSITIPQALLETFVIIK